MFEELSSKPAAWLSGNGTQAGTVLSSRVRLARNLYRFKFPPAADAEVRKKVVGEVRSAVERSILLKSGKFFQNGELGGTDRDFLVERHVISPEFMKTGEGYGLFLGEDESLSVMVNEEDHLRIQALTSGLEVGKAHELATQADAELAASLAFEYDEEFGYLTACPTNVGTGLRASVLIHLPALVLTREIDSVINRVAKVGWAVRGFYGEGTDVLGNLLQLSNQTTLGRSEAEILEGLEKVTRQVIEYEENARYVLLRDAKEQIEDKIWRAYGILRFARVLTSSEVMNLLSAVRLGLGMGVIKEIPLGLVNELLLLCQPAHLQKFAGREMEPSERDALRAELVRSRIEKGFPAPPNGPGNSKTV
ncbi:MAG: protein arginine kinase [candidate division Zixibacteria bacterium]|nr:protein arginine kinase [candidate division Zixibacteria bacterium]MCI0596812.1 protein arginine kinase [candidate division Zixibacteria bacterium]